MTERNSYFERVGMRPSPLVEYVLTHFVSRRISAVDLGAGNLRDARYMLGQGFRRVVAVDNNLETLKYSINEVETVIADITEFLPEDETFDFAICHNTLYFLDEAGTYCVFYIH